MQQRNRGQICLRGGGFDLGGFDLGGVLSGGVMSGYRVCLSVYLCTPCLERSRPFNFVHHQLNIHVYCNNVAFGISVDSRHRDMASVILFR